MSAGQWTSLALALLAFISLAPSNVAFLRSFSLQAGQRQQGGVGMPEGQTSRRFAVKPDLFSDDLFEDDGGKKASASDSKQPSSTNKEKGATATRMYLDQKWKLNSEDAKDFKGFPKKGVDPRKAFAVKSGTTVPVFALMYKFRKEYTDGSVDSVMADHRGHCAKYKRLLNSELLALKKSRGVVLLWAGFNEGDKEETRAEITKFLEEDPLIAKDIVENWDLVDIGHKENPVAGMVDALPGGEKN